MFTKSNATPSFQAPNIPGLVRQNPDLGGGLDQLFNQYMQMQAAKKSDALNSLQTQLTQQQIAAGQRQSAMADLQETAQFGAPLSAYSPQQIQRAGQGFSPQGPGLDPANERLQKLAQGLHAIGEKTRMASKMQEAELGKTQAETAKLNAEAGAIPGAKDAAKKKAATDLENQLRDELNKLSGPFDQITSAYSKVNEAAKNPSAAGDLSLIFGYMKILDPGSTVREGEQATAEAARGVPSAVRNMYNKVITGEKLTPEQRRDFVVKAKELYDVEEKIQRRRESSYHDISTRSGANPEQVIVRRGFSGEVAREEVPLKDASGKTRIALYEGPKFVGWK